MSRWSWIKSTRGILFLLALVSQFREIFLSFRLEVSSGIGGDVGVGELNNGTPFISTSTRSLLNAPRYIQVINSTIRQQKRQTAHHNSSIVQSTTGSSYYNKSNSNTQSNNDHKWAYAFLVSGCSEESPGYRGFLYNTIVTVQRLRDLGSQADFVLFVQIKQASSYQTLPSDEEHLLQQLHIHVKYLPKFRSSVHEVFYAMVQEKFRVLQLVEYDRVIFLDGDILPLCNLDYLFQVSSSSISTPVLPSNHRRSNLKNQQEATTTMVQFKENIIVAQTTEGANAGLFLLTPKVGDWERIQEVIRKKEERALELPWPHWDEKVGWGKVITPPDYWRPINGSKLNVWDWHAVFADQGLLYYWTKYVKKNVSIIIGSEIEHWSSISEEDEVFLERIDGGSPLNQFSCQFANRFRSGPYAHFHHFTGSSKPWHSDLSQPAFATKNGGSWAERANLWRDTLLQVQLMTGYNFSMLTNSTSSSFQSTFKRKGKDPPPMGRFSTYAEMIKHIRARKTFDWQHYDMDEERNRK